MWKEHVWEWVVYHILEGPAGLSDNKIVTVVKTNFFSKLKIDDTTFEINIKLYWQKNYTNTQFLL